MCTWEGTAHLSSLLLVSVMSLTLSVVEKRSHCPLQGCPPHEAWEQDLSIWEVHTLARPSLT